ncbi:SDR family NAD(P)-dependent oxidoreductase [Seonamhaeicola sp. ML3]|uniref:SDR family NAD(P)-dependent oxidoreductase n=1 Tax=Seonamhaeicola sp. ML3 TaxID=2937786 RepID=UPI0020100C41|nr:SDR family NAD(P)-dependent oxidoreductase [Seonamhaeicola sp. ML3]
MNKRQYEKLQNVIDGFDLEIDQIKSQQNPDFNSRINFNKDVILITGAAGSLGAELVKQLLDINFKQLILIDNNETALFSLSKKYEKELENSNTELIPVDVRDEEAMNWLFDNYKPSIIFHTAAYKNIPLMEHNAYEAIRLNVFSTKLLADLSVAHHVKKFIFISTNNAVNPISVVGRTKLVSEAYLNYLKIHSQTDFKAIRLGNIFESKNSLLIKFMKQVQNGKAISIANSECEKYFINKFRACQLILKTTVLTKGDGFVFTYNMGKPFKVVELAKQISSRIAKTDKYPIEFIGLEDWEKKSEELLAEHENIEFTVHDDILRIKSSQGYTGEKISFNLISVLKTNMTNIDIKNRLEDCVLKLQTSPALLFAI